MYATGIVVALLGAVVGLLVSAVDINGPFLVISLLGFVAAFLGSKYAVRWMCTVALPDSVWRAILSKTFLNRFDPVQATLNYVRREEKPARHMSVCLRQETEQLIDLIVRDFVMSWYEWISNDQFVPDEVAVALHDAVARAHKMFQLVDQHKVFKEIILLGRVHLTCYQHALANVDRKESAQDYQEAVARLYREKFSKLMQNQPDADNELSFLRRVTDLFLGLVLPATDLRCEPARQVLSDVLSLNVMQRVVDLLVDPDWINEVIIIALTDTPVETLKLIESFDESPASDKSKSKTNIGTDASESLGAGTSTVGKTTAGNSVTNEDRPKQPVASDPRTASLRSELADSLPQGSPSDSPEISGQFEAPVVLNKLEGNAVIGIVGRQTVRNSSIEMEYVTYSIQYKPALLWPENTSLDLVLEVRRRYKQFDSLFSRMKENPRLSKALQGLSLPSKRILPLITQNQMQEFAQARQESLDAFLKELCCRSSLRQCEEFKSFLREGTLRDGSVGLLPRVFGVMNGIIRPRTRSGTVSGLHPHWHKEEVGGKVAVDVFHAFTRSCSMEQHPVRVKQPPDMIDCGRAVGSHEWDLRCEDWQRRAKSAEQSTWRGEKSAQCEDALRTAMFSKQLNTQRPSVTLGTTPRDADFAILDRRWPVTSAFFELGTTAVVEPTSLKNDLVQKLVICVFGKIVDCFVCSELDELLRERRLAYIVRLLRELLWPDGHWPEEPVEEKRTDEQRRANKAEALQKLIEFLPGFLRIIVGPKTYDRGFAHVLESLQNPAINRCLAHSLINLLVERLATCPAAAESIAESASAAPASPLTPGKTV